jgi:folate-binding protein YgfZ
MLKAFLNKDIKIIKVHGADAKEYLNNIVTNNIDEINTSNTIYSCLLSPQGKFIADFFISYFDGGFYLLTNCKFYNDLIEALNFYKLRSKINIEDADKLYKYFFIPNNKYKFLFASDKVIVGQTILKNESYAFNDPRIENFGIHIISKKEAFGDIKLDIIKDDCLEHSFKYGILNMYLIKNLNKFYPLENNLHFLNAIDFKKGCYVGQELTARMKLRNKIPRTIIPFILDDKNNTNLNTLEIFENNNSVGEIIFQKEKYIFGHITLRKLSNKISSNMKFFAGDQQLMINHQNWLTF